MTMRPLTIVLVLFAVSLAMMAGVPSWRQAARNTIIPDQRKIVAKIQGTISETGPHLVIFKVKTRDQFFLEVYRSIDSIELIQRIALEEAADGRFEYQGRFTNLALADMDMDGTY